MYEGMFLYNTNTVWVLIFERSKFWGNRKPNQIFSWVLFCGYNACTWTCLFTSAIVLNGTTNEIIVNNGE